jgi:tetratricopeptide (TPR) repeat protein
MKYIFGLMSVVCHFVWGNQVNPTQQSQIEICQKPLIAEISKAERLTDRTAKEAEKARLNFYIGRCAFAQNESEGSIPYFERGQESAEKALESEPEDVSALFWWGANRGVLADIKRNLSALKAIKDIEDKLIVIRSKNPDFAFSGADRVLGKIYHKAPGFISIGSTSKAEECLKRAFEKFPKFPGNVITLAEFYEDEGKTEEAKKLILPLLASHQIQNGDYGSFNVEKWEWEKLANQLVQKWGDKK